MRGMAHGSRRFVNHHEINSCYLVPDELGHDIEELGILAVRHKHLIVQYVLNLAEIIIIYVHRTNLVEK